MTILFEILSNTTIVLYILCIIGLALYGINCYIMIFLFRRSRKKARIIREKILSDFKDIAIRNDLPYVTTQIAVFNELNVVERVILAACRMNYAKGKHEIQVLDDSTDETKIVIDDLIRKLKNEGHQISVVRRAKRIGYKAGALAEGLRLAKGELIAVFDADFVPPEYYLLRAVPFLMANKRAGLVQARWGHLNRKYSLLTRLQSIGIDGHFMIEQAARNWNNLYMNFNGTAGIWRKEAIEEGGGWQWDTLTEDMDLSYRVQLLGWETCYLPDLVVPAEIPEDVNAFKSQQFRWAKGSIQTAKKLLPRLFKAKVPIFKKVEAFFHLTHYMVHPLMLIVAILALPVLLTLEINLSPLIFAILGTLLIFTLMAPNTLYIVSQHAAYKDWYKRIIFLPFLVVAGVGIAISNSKAVFEALIGHESGFVRTPKRGDKEIKQYKISFPFLAFFEILLGIYCVISLSYYLSAEKYLVGPFLAIYAAGFLFTGLLTFAHLFQRKGF